MNKCFVLAIVALAFTGCSSRPQTPVEAPKPGMIGLARFSTDDNSTSERVTFRTRIAEPQVRTAFEQYCLRRQMKRDLRAATTGITWWQSKDYYLGILTSANPQDHTLAVTYFYNR